MRTPRIAAFAAKEGKVHQRDILLYLLSNQKVKTEQYNSNRYPVFYLLE